MWNLVTSESLPVNLTMEQAILEQILTSINPLKERKSHLWNGQKNKSNQCNFWRSSHILRSHIFMRHQRKCFNQCVLLVLTYCVEKLTLTKNTNQWKNNIIMLTSRSEVTIYNNCKNIEFQKEELRGTLGQNERWQMDRKNTGMEIMISHSLQQCQMTWNRGTERDIDG